MALTIKDPATETAVRELAARTGETVTAAVRKAAEERLMRLGNQCGCPDLAMDLLSIGARCASLPDVDHRSADDILGYDDDGLPG